MSRYLRRLFNLIGLEVTRFRPHAPDSYPIDLDTAVVETIKQVRGDTQTSVERIAALCHAVEYVTRYAIPGAIVECGVWRGGSMSAVAHTLARCGDVTRDLYLFDTFEGLPEPGEHDVRHDGASAEKLLGRERKEDTYSMWCRSPLEVVRGVMGATGYPAERVHFVVGKVEDTLPECAPQHIAILRLDTDWYESTRHELEHLFPRLVPGGVLIVDDYGHWQGARRAVDEYFLNHPTPMLLNRIDYTGRIGVYFPLAQGATQTG
jgi:hypothetical protein